MFDTPEPSMTSLTQERVLNELTFPTYRACVEKAKSLFSDQTAIQSASATMFINLTNNTKLTASLDAKLRDKIATINPDAIPSAISVWKWHFRDLISEFGARIIGQISYCVSTAMSNEEIEQYILRYASELRDANARNNTRSD